MSRASVLRLSKDEVEVMGVHAAAAVAGNDGVTRLPLRGNGFYVCCDGMKIMTTPERIGEGS